MTETRTETDSPGAISIPQAAIEPVLSAEQTAIALSHLNFGEVGNVE